MSLACDDALRASDVRFASLARSGVGFADDYITHLAMFVL
jgi:hypothetical protein